MAALVDSLRPPGEAKAAAISDDGRYRYTLERIWDPSKVPAVFCMLNPSTADASQDDPTIRRCRGFAQTLGYGGLIVVNLFALRSTDPTALLDADDPIGPGNDEQILAAAARGDGTVICAWGTGGALHFRGRDVLALLKKRGGFRPMRLGPPTNGGNPRHPLYLPRTAALEAL
ncbi:MAG TPA: DUF1643 domain-containing protein [Anaeromyxobacteraceae bacterium]|nr:DUF1643 domain-containing protein [Anaeromyxobacteraceae bacterium]